MIKSLPMLLDVILLCAFTFFIFGIVAVQLFSGQLRFRWGLMPKHAAVGSMAEQRAGHGVRQ